MSDDVLVGGEIFPSHFFGQKIRPSLTTSKEACRHLTNMSKQQGFNSEFGWSN
jgi:hypothetical protein